ncbi:MAG: hypothetical protein ACP5I6_07890 [Caldisphaera sp.]
MGWTIYQFPPNVIGSRSPSGFTSSSGIQQRLEFREVPMLDHE